jgi:hypothetical protein
MNYIINKILKVFFKTQYQIVYEQTIGGKHVKYWTGSEIYWSVSVAKNVFQRETIKRRRIGSLSRPKYIIIANPLD